MRALKEAAAAEAVPPVEESAPVAGVRAWTNVPMSSVPMAPAYALPPAPAFMSTDRAPIPQPTAAPERPTWDPTRAEVVSALRPPPAGGQQDDPYAAYLKTVAHEARATAALEVGKPPEPTAPRLEDTMERVTEIIGITQENQDSYTAPRRRPSPEASARRRQSPKRCGSASGLVSERAASQRQPRERPSRDTRVATSTALSKQRRRPPPTAPLDMNAVAAAKLDAMLELVTRSILTHPEAYPVR